MQSVMPFVIGNVRGEHGENVRQLKGIRQDRKEKTAQPSRTDMRSWLLFMELLISIVPVRDIPFYHIKREVLKRYAMFEPWENIIVVYHAISRNDVHLVSSVAQ